MKTVYIAKRVDSCNALSEVPDGTAVAHLIYGGKCLRAPGLPKLILLLFAIPWIQACGQISYVSPEKSSADSTSPSISDPPPTTTTPPPTGNTLVNLLENGNFEAGLSSWVVNSPAIIAATSDPHSGLRHLQLRNGGETAYQQSKYAAVPGAVYRLRFESQADVGDIVTAGIAFYSAGGGLLQEEFVRIQSLFYDQYDMVTVAPAGAYSIRLSFYKGDGVDTADFDDVVLERLP